MNRVATQRQAGTETFEVGSIICDFCEKRIDPDLHSMSASAKKKRLASGHAAKLLEEAHDVALPLELGLREGGAVICKKLLRAVPGRRMVFKAEYGSVDVVAKVYAAGPGLSRRLRREERGFELLDKASVPHPAYIGTFHAGNAGICLVEYLRGYSTLSLFLRESTEKEIDRTISRALDIVFSMHQAGVVQQDIHLDNFMAGEGAVKVVDAALVKQKSVSPLPREAASENLAALVARFPLELRNRVLKKIAQKDTHKLYDIALLERRMEKMWRRDRAEYVKKRFRRCTDVEISSSPFHFAAYRREAENIAGTFTGDPEKTMERGSVLKAGRSATIMSIPEDEQGEFVVKRYNLKTCLHALKRCCRPSRAWKSWRAAWLFEFSGIKTAPTLAFLERRFFFLRGRSYLLMERCPGIESGELYPQGNPPDDVLEAFGALFGRMIDSDLTHGDMKKRNFLLDGTEIYLLDLDSVKAHRSLHSFKIAFKKDMLRFMRNWPENSKLYGLANSFIESLRLENH